jgi:hypothetical protein
MLSSWSILTIIGQVNLTLRIFTHPLNHEALYAQGLVS